MQTTITSMLSPNRVRDKIHDNIDVNLLILKSDSLDQCLDEIVDQQLGIPRPRKDEIIGALLPTIKGLR